ncbi:MAG: FtsH protease activity modulator HflK [Pseudomonadales bacterium]|nr:FtsH protease activity modulator HflK [Pseudomonadales bacterium]
MGWNEPGGGRDKDPWGNRGDQGPPDLDEAFRKLQSNLTGIFRGGGGGASGSGGSLSGRMIGAIAAAILLIWAAFGVYTVDEQERGVVLRFGAALNDVVMPGLHWNPPLIDRVMVANVTRVRSWPHESEMLTEDENIVKAKMTIQYVVDDVRQFLLEVREPEISLQHATESALRHVVGSSEMHAVLTEGRAALAQDVKTRVQDYVNLYGTGILVSQVNIDETAPPDAVRAAFDDVIKAREDEVRFRNEANAYANQVVPEARGEAQQLREQAQAYKERVIARAGGDAERFNKLYFEYSQAPEVTRERMYLDTMESVMSNSTKVMVDVQGGNNIMYLPLDKIVQQSQGQSESSRSNTFAPDRTSGSQSSGSSSRRESGRRDR